MIKIGKIDSSKFDSLKRRILKVLTFGKSSVNNVYECAAHGVDTNPPKGKKAIVVESVTNGEKFILGYVNESQKSEVGGYRVYATDDQGNEQNNIYLRPDGTIEIGGDTDFMVRYTALETAFNELQQKFNSHVHPGVQAGPGATSPTTTPSTGDITQSKIEEIKTS
jgi:hypothetical protein